MHPWARSVLVVAVVAAVLAAPVAGVASSAAASTATASDSVDQPAPDAGSPNDSATDWSSLVVDDEDDEETDDDERESDEGGDEADDESENDEEADEDEPDGDDDDGDEWDWDDESEEDDESEDEERWWEWWSDDEDGEDDRERDPSGSDDGDGERGAGDGPGSEDGRTEDGQSESSSDEDAAESDSPGDEGTEEASADRRSRADSQEADGSQADDQEEDDGTEADEGAPEDDRDGERNETRNRTADPGPDLGSSNVTVVRTPEVVGQPLVVNATTENVGTEPGRKVLQFEVEHEIVDREVFVLQPNESRTVTFTHVFETPGNKTFEVDAGLNRFVTVEERRPNLTVNAVGATPASVAAGEDVTITALVTNTGTANGSRPVALELFGEVVAVENVTLATGESAAVTFTRTVYAAGSYEAAVQNETASFRVTGESETDSRSPANESVLASSVETDGFGVLAALAAVALAVALAVGRRP